MNLKHIALAALIASAAPLSMAQSTSLPVGVPNSAVSSVTAAATVNPDLLKAAQPYLVLAPKVVRGDYSRP